MPFSTDIFGSCEGLFFCLGSWYSSVTSGVFWVVILIIFAAVLFMATVNPFGTSRAFGFSVFAMSLGALFMVQLTYIPVWFMTLSIVLGILGVIVMINQGK